MLTAITCKSSCKCSTPGAWGAANFTHLKVHVDTYNGPRPYDEFRTHTDYVAICDVREKGEEFEVAKDDWKVHKDCAADWGYFACTVSACKQRAAARSICFLK